MEDIRKQERQTKRELTGTKKEVDFIPHTPPKVKSKNVAGPPVYYPPGSAEFTKKEESNVAVSQSSVSYEIYRVTYARVSKNIFPDLLRLNSNPVPNSFQGGWQKASGKYEYEASGKSKSSKGAAVVPVCLPLCCALPCVIM